MPVVLGAPGNRTSAVQPVLWGILALLALGSVLGGYFLWSASAYWDRGDGDRMDKVAADPTVIAALERMRAAGICGYVNKGQPGPHVIVMESVRPCGLPRDAASYIKLPPSPFHGKIPNTSAMTFQYEGDTWRIYSLAKYGTAPFENYVTAVPIMADVIIANFAGARDRKVRVEAAGAAAQSSAEVNAAKIRATEF